ncbi:TetR/AcrR family transcriptional regulator C-terminal domain-containing protein [Svornostia abyssi]|uniref:TetR/AcrR family transcriptional regulator C-terminal domain-containing protein n=1 Tax=Svornostia abyssi TaxID=2898438 RepID=A0ABY5PKM7_9ACTN|nr:TetR/AcrR family transcriptional regulator C-terminal domain-containing protein [Parviterribacteraceae bacterium J379]
MSTGSKPRRGRPPRLSRPLIVEAALALVDRAGIDGLTMRALARELEADPMAVYRHVRDKEDLLGAMCDQLLVELPPIDLDGAWEPQVRGLAREIRERFAARPALLPALASAPVTPMSLVLASDAVTLLVRAGMSPREAAGGFGAVFSYVLGFAVIEAAIPPPADHEALRAAALGHLGTDEAPPHIDVAIELMNSAGDFDFGLDLVLEGLRARLA